jgi:2-polyprenyl-6-methoxyphenol hydroxylase-like FAD-dependent oxidoreductase
LNFSQSDRGVLVRCQDGSTFSGDVLVGADGAHSAVRQHLYSTLEEESKLPAADKRQMTKGYACLVGTTRPLDPSKYPGIENPSSSAAIVIADKSPYTVSESFWGKNVGEKM